MVLRFHPKNPKIIYAGTSEGQILSCDISDFVHDGQDYDHIPSDKDERWTEIIRGKPMRLPAVIILYTIFMHINYFTT